MFKQFMNDDNGATAIEYGLIAALVGIAIIIGLGALGSGLNTQFSSVATKVSN